MTVHKEILEWSRDRPCWQRDGLRRLVLNNELSEDDIHELTELCKSVHGIADQQNFIPLTTEHLSGMNSSPAQVTLSSISHQRGVNALAENQTLNFATGLTVVYGDNAAGKTGYIRILKNACRARGREDILGNIASDGTSQAPIVTINYRVGTEEKLWEWSGQGDDDFISRVNVFDAQCAAVYLTEKTDVAFRPFGLDLFDKLVQACKAVRVKLEFEQSHVTTSLLTEVRKQVPEGTAVAKLLEEITFLTKAENVRALARLSPDEEARLELLKKSLLDLNANDPQKLARQLTLRAERVRTLTQHLSETETMLSADAINALFSARREAHQKSEEAKSLRATMLQAGELKGTGSGLWTTLWESARRFSQEQAYADQLFPVVETGARCVLCQQVLDCQSVQRLKQFETFVTSTMERELRKCKEVFEQLQERFTDFKIDDYVTTEVLKEIEDDHESEHSLISAALKDNKNRQKAVIDALTSGNVLDPALPALVLIAHKVDKLVDQLEERVKTLGGTSNDATKQQITDEFQELHARKLLAQYEDLVLNEIERKKKVAAYELCLNDTKTQAITLKSAAVTRTAVTQKLKQSFQEELSNLGFYQVDVKLEEAGGEAGVLYHKLILARAPGVELPRVVSEGEQRCISLAAFLAELTTADELSGIVFDDPVSSLDYRWREGVARRLVEEAKRRQVIVFTHDIVFLLLLKQFSGEQSIEQKDQHVRQLPKGAGVCTEELPWVALKVSKRIGYLKNLLQKAEKSYREGHLSAYEQQASMAYGYLREAWERAIEEVLLCGVVERYRPGVQTLQVMQLADITEEDCRNVETAMSKCSKWLTGHDQAAAARADIPGPDELKKDIGVLENWISEIRKRRK